MDIAKKTAFWRAVMVSTFILCMAPLLVVAVYDHSTSDDFSYGWMVRLAWVESKSLWEVLKAVLLTVKEYYHTWQGSYAAIAVFALQPAVWGERFYFLAPYILLGLFVFSGFYFFRRICRDIMGAGKSVADIIAAVVLLLSMEMAPSPSQAFFWWNGASYYVLFHSLLLILTADLLVCADRDQCSVHKWARLGLLGLVIAGGNYISSLLALEIVFCISAYAAFKKKQAAKGFAGIFLLMLVGFLVNCLAPGNAVRQRGYESLPPLKAILYSYHAAYLDIEKWTEPILIIALVFLFPFLWEAVKKIPCLKAGEYCLLFLLSFSLFVSSYTPTLYAYGEAGPGRIQNIRYFLWILYCIFGEVMLIGVIKKSGQWEGRFGVLFWGMVLLCGMFALTNRGLDKEKQDFTTVSALKSLVYGEAKKYDQEVKERIILLEGEDSEVYAVPYQAHPPLLFLIDLQEDPDNWINDAVAKFYQKDKVYLKQ